MWKGHQNVCSLLCSEYLVPCRRVDTQVLVAGVTLLENVACLDTASHFKASSAIIAVGFTHCHPVVELAYSGFALAHPVDFSCGRFDMYVDNQHCIIQNAGTRTFTQWILCSAKTQAVQWSIVTFSSGRILMRLCILHRFDLYPDSLAMA